MCPCGGVAKRHGYGSVPGWLSSGWLPGGSSAWGSEGGWIFVVVWEGWFEYEGTFFYYYFFSVFLNFLQLLFFHLFSTNLFIYFYLSIHLSYSSFQLEPCACLTVRPSFVGGWYHFISLSRHPYDSVLTTLTTRPRFPRPIFPFWLYMKT